MNEQFRQRIFSKRMMTFAILSIVITGFLGYFLIDAKTGTAMMEEFMESVDHIFTDGEIKVFPLFLNNLTAALVMVLTGFIPFIYFPAIIGAVNGTIIGVALKFAGTGIAPLKLFLAGILPHGIFEIPALILAIAIGLSICHSLVLKIMGRESIPMGDILITSAITYVKYIIPLLIVAAFIETYITPMILGRFL
ncbi:MAG: stage II sporulation protein M [Tissierellia bacterium]|nr:stage II sporulation protein M [Tissierellia bacterium]